MVEINEKINLNIDKNYLKNMQEAIVNALKKIKRFIKQIFRFIRRNDDVKLEKSFKELKEMFWKVKRLLRKSKDCLREYSVFVSLYVFVKNILDDNLLDYFYLVEDSFNDFYTIFKLKNNVSDELYYKKLQEFGNRVFFKYSSELVSKICNSNESRSDEPFKVINCVPTNYIDGGIDEWFS